LGADIADLILQVLQRELQQEQVLQLLQEPQQEQVLQLLQEPQQEQVQQLALLLQQVPLFLQVLLLLRLYYSQTIKPSQPSLSL
jgi:hypothetical protein